MPKYVPHLEVTAISIRGAVIIQHKTEAAPRTKVSMIWDPRPALLPAGPAASDRWEGYAPGTPSGFDPFNTCLDPVIQAPAAPPLTPLIRAAKQF